MLLLSSLSSLYSNIEIYLPTVFTYLSTYDESSPKTEGITVVSEQISSLDEKIDSKIEEIKESVKEIVSHVAKDTAKVG